MTEYWIGPEINRSGGYVPVSLCRGLKQRRETKATFYKYTTLFDDVYNISDKTAVQKIQAYVNAEQEDALSSYLNQLIIQHHSADELMKKIIDATTKAYLEGLDAGKQSIQEDLRRLLGIGGEVE